MDYDITQFLDTIPFILEMEGQGLVTRTFRRLDPQRQNQIIQAILEEAYETSPDEINVKKVAARSASSIGSLYQYFGNRENLLEFTTRLVTRTMVASMESVHQYLMDMPLREALKTYLTSGVEYSRMMGGYIRYYAAAAYRGTPGLGEKVVRPVAEIMQQLVRELIRAAMERGEIRPDVDPESITRLVNVILIAIGDAQLAPYLNQYYLLYDADHSLDTILDTFLDLLDKGIAAEKKA